MLIKQQHWQEKKKSLTALGWRTSALISHLKLNTNTKLNLIGTASTGILSWINLVYFIVYSKMFSHKTATKSLHQLNTELTICNNYWLLIRLIKSTGLINLTKKKVTLNYRQWSVKEKHSITPGDWSLLCLNRQEWK